MNSPQRRAELVESRISHSITCQNIEGHAAKIDASHVYELSSDSRWLWKKAYDMILKQYVPFEELLKIRKKAEHVFETEEKISEEGQKANPVLQNLGYAIKEYKNILHSLYIHAYKDAMFEELLLKVAEKEDIEKALGDNNIDVVYKAVNEPEVLERIYDTLIVFEKALSEEKKSKSSLLGLCHKMLKDIKH